MEKRFDSLRETDREARRQADMELSRRLDGFPQLYATKADVGDSTRTIQKLERDSISREMYDQHRAALEDSVHTKLSAAIFQGFVENYRIDQERNAASHDSFLSQEYYDEKHNDLVTLVGSLQAWQYKIVGALVLATFIAPLITGILVYMFTTGKI